MTTSAPIVWVVIVAKTVDQCVRSSWACFGSPVRFECTGLSTSLEMSATAQEQGRGEVETCAS